MVSGFRELPLRGRRGKLVRGSSKSVASARCPPTDKAPRYRVCSRFTARHKAERFARASSDVALLDRGWAAGPPARVVVDASRHARRADAAICGSDSLCAVARAIRPLACSRRAAVLAARKQPDRVVDTCPRRLTVPAARPLSILQSPMG